MTTTDTHEPHPTAASGIWPAIGGGLLALGIALTFLPGVFRSATGLTSPAYHLLQTIGMTSLALATVVFAAMGVRAVTHAIRHAAVR